MTNITFETTLYTINDWLILHLPTEKCKELSSRGMLQVRVTIQDSEFLAVLEPDGNQGHWCQISDSFAHESGLKAGDTIIVAMEELSSWFEPEVPADLQTALSLDSLTSTWDSLTTKARWEWVRWIRFTNNPDTRSKRILTCCSMLMSGKRRPCCFDHSRCTQTEVAKNGVLLY